jgi:NAD(P)-dependent dehydrogenase (short-subunit alcohol dehydrogenase family)
MTKKPRLAFVTGASRGIGKAIAQLLLENGYQVACGYARNKAGAEELERAFPQAKAVHIEMRERASIHAAVAEAQKHFGQPVTIVVNNAAIADERPLEDITDAQWDRMLETNLRGPFVMSQETLPGMLAARWGRFVNIVSIGGQWGGMRQVHYAAAKAGLINYTQSLAKLYSSKGITSNAVSPGLVGTDMAENELQSEAGRQKAAAIPIGRIASPREIAAAVLYLCSDDAAYVTGHTLNVNGGMYFQ